LGETVLALGNPFGLGGSVSRGILSSKNRRPPVEGEPLDVADWLQTDAAINPGSSGGPLINLHGELVGLNVAIYGEGHGIGFAIPIKQVTEALSEIFIPEVTQSAWFGARLKSGPYPLTVTEVERDSPAAKAGLQKGDEVVQVNGRTPKDFIQCTEWIRDGSNHEVTLVIRRDGDMYSSTTQSLMALYPKLSVGGYCIVDDYNNIAACRQAVTDYRATHGIDEKIESIDWGGVYWQRLR